MVEAEVFADLYTQLRDPSSQGINEAASTLDELYQDPESIIPLITVAEESDDLILKQYALYGICVCLRKSKSIENPELIPLCQNKMIEFLSSTEDTSLLNSIISVISTIYALCDWPEIFDNIFDEGSNLEIVLQILMQLIHSMKIPSVYQHFDQFKGLIMKGIQSNNAHEAINAINLLFNIIGPIEDPEVRDSFQIFSEPLFDVFSQIAPNGDSDLLTQTLTPIIYGYEKEVDILPFEQSVDLIIQLLMPQNLDVEYALRLHSFLAYLLAYHKLSEFSADEISEMFELEISLALVFFEQEDIDTMNWLFDLDQTLQELFFRLVPEDVIQLADVGLEALSEIDSAEAHATTMLILENAIPFALDAFSERFDDIFEMVLSLLSSSEIVERRLSMRLLTVMAQKFSTQISLNQQQTIEAITTVASSESEEEIIELTKLLLAVMQVMYDSDPVFEDVNELALSFMQSSDQLVQANGVYTTACMIEHSQVKMDFIFEEMFNRTMELLSIDNPAELESPRSTAFTIVSALCLRNPKEMKEKLSDFIPIVVGAMESEDVFAQQDAIRCFMMIVEPMMPEISEVFGEVAEHLSNLIEAESWSVNLTTLWQAQDYFAYNNLERKYILACLCLECLGKIAVAQPEESIMERLAEFMVKFIGFPHTSSMNSSIAAFESFVEAIRKIGGIDDNLLSALDQMVSQCFILKLASPEDVVAILKALRAAIRCCGVTIIPDILMAKLISLIKDFENPHTGLLCVDPAIHDSALFTYIIVACIRAKEGEGIDEIMPVLDGIMRQPESASSRFAFEIISRLIQALPQHFEDEFKNNIVDFAVQQIIDGNSNIASAAAVFLSELCGGEESSQLVAGNSQEILNVLITRMRATEQQDLKECLANAICTIADEFELDISENLAVIGEILPLVKHIEFSDCVYQYVFTRLNDSLAPLFLRDIVGLAGRSIIKLEAMDLTPETIAIIYRCGEEIWNQSSANRDEVIATIFGSDEMRTQLYEASWSWMAEVSQSVGD